MAEWKKKGKDLDWEGMFRKYVWNTNTTPYLTAVPDLNRFQANSEIRFYCWFLSILFGVIAVVTIRGGVGGASVGVSYYALSVVCAAVMFGIAKVYAAALYLSATPLAGLVYLWFYGLGDARPFGDTVIVTVVLLAMLAYSPRIVAVARAYPELPVPPDAR